VERLTRVAKTLGSEKSSLDTALRVAPTAIGNLALAFNNKTGTIGSRIGITGNVWDADGFLCGVVQQAGLPQASADLACKLFKQLLEPVEGQLPTVPPGPQGQAGRSSGSTDGLNRVQQYAAAGGGSLASLMGGGS
jgi:phospholipid/cholesterol/gamma-HCH transport system substrate-binding protein